MLCCRRGRSYQHDVALRVQAHKSVITTHIHFVANSDMQLNSYKRYPRRIPFENADHALQLRASNLFPAAVRLHLTYWPSTDGGWWPRVGGWSMALSKNALQPLYFLQFVALCPECVKPFSSLTRTSLGFSWGFSRSMAFNNWLLLSCFFFKVFWCKLRHLSPNGLTPQTTRWNDETVTGTKILHNQHKTEVGYRLLWK
jgi:hypothetical protein